MLKVSDFDYFLPEDLIAQSPSERREDSRLLVYNTHSDSVSHNHFFDIENFLEEGDVLVLNSSRVIPARISFEERGKSREIFLLKKVGKLKYRAMVRPGKAFKVGNVFSLKNGEARVVEVLGDGTRVFDFDVDPLELGELPLPPYITDFDGDIDRYQTVYARQGGSVAAPTAGLHFSENLMSRLKARGVVFVEVVLHVGRGTFLPVKTNKIADHVMHSEEFEISESAAKALNKAKADDRRIIAVGTTSVRVLESSFDDGFCPRRGSTDIFIHPGYEWKVVDGLITNFHLPKSTLLMLVASFLESKNTSPAVDRLMSLYELAIEERYRFYSFGDACFIF